MVVDGSGWLWLVLGGFGWLWVVVGGFGSFLVLVCTFKGTQTPELFACLTLYHQCTCRTDSNEIFNGIVVLVI